MPGPVFLLKLNHYELLRVWCIKCHSSYVWGSRIHTALQHQSRGRALNLMTDATSLLLLLPHTLLHMHTHIHTYEVYECVGICCIYSFTDTRCLIPTLSFVPLLSFTHTFFSISSSSLLPYPILSNPSDDCDGDDSHYESQIIWVTGYLKVSAHISLSLPPFLSLSISLFLFCFALCTAHFLSCFSFFFSKFQSVASRICLYTTSERKGSQNIRGNVKLSIHFFPFTATLFCVCWL